jgi:signal transduction histidine kinase/DNA-binding LytR/AlgR family response regulator
VSETDATIKVLLIAEDPAEAERIRQLFQPPGEFDCQLEWVSTVESGREAIDHCWHQVLLLDLQFKDNRTGVELFRYILEQDCKMPVIVLTSENTPEITPPQSRAVDYIVKEQLTSALLQKTIRYLQKYAQLTDTLHQTQSRLETQIRETEAEYTKTTHILQEKLSEVERLKQGIQESLDRRTNQVEISIQIAQEISAASALDALFRLVVNLIQERFGYYHAHIYTLDNNYLVMQEGTGDPALKMKDLGHKIPITAARSLVAKAARSGEPILVTDVSKDKRWLPNHLLADTKSELAVPIKLGGNVLGVLDIQDDIVGGLNAEDQLVMMGLCGQIAVAINTKTMDMEREKAEEAQQRLIHELDAFGHTVGHNLKDPVGLIVGYGSLLKEKISLSDELNSYLNAIIRNSRRLNNIIEELQLLAGVRQEEVKVVPLNMLRIIAEVQQRLAYLIQERNARIIIAEYWPVALGYPQWVEEVWANYISNAIIYGGDPPVVHIGATLQSDGMIRFWVRDNGDGLSAAEQESLFAEFTRMHQASLKGHGLGLSIVQRIVGKLGGQAGVNSEGIPGKGCMFTFTLPQAEV